MFFFCKLLFQNMLIRLSEKESPQYVLLNIQHESDHTNTPEYVSLLKFFSKCDLKQCKFLNKRTW